jgi:mRNA interferase RelE/StbE
VILYSVMISKSARREVKRIPASVVERIAAVIRAFPGQPRPHGSLKLEGEEDTYRIRVGNYRIVYEINDANKTVFITCVRHHREAYD